LQCSEEGFNEPGLAQKITKEALCQSASMMLETLLAMLTNDLTSHLAGDVALVLDDYHVITAAPLHHAMIFLVEHCPPQLHLVLASRADPPLPLARLRARGQLTEFRAAQLQFAEDETRLFLQMMMGLDLSSEEVATM
jgi:LuxR family maltose regulon positive regulatory protein